MGTAALHMTRMNTSHKSYGKSVGTSHSWSESESKNPGKYVPYWTEPEEKEKKDETPDWVKEQQKKIEEDHYLCWDEQIWSGDKGSIRYTDDYQIELRQPELDQLMNQCMHLTFDLPLYCTDYRTILSFESICKILLRNDYTFDQAVVSHDNYYKAPKMTLIKDDMEIPIINLYNRKYTLHSILLGARTCQAGKPASQEITAILPFFDNL